MTGKIFESNNKSIALNTLYIPYNTKEIRRAYKSKHNLNHKNQVIVLLISNGKKWHYLALKKLFPLLWGKTSNPVGDLYCQNCYHSSSTQTLMEKLWLLLRRNA